MQCRLDDIELQYSLLPIPGKELLCKECYLALEGDLGSGRVVGVNEKSSVN